MAVISLSGERRLGSAGRAREARRGRSRRRLDTGTTRGRGIRATSGRAPSSRRQQRRSQSRSTAARSALIRDVQYDPVSRFLHLDFQQISLTGDRVGVAVHLMSLAVGVKDGGGVSTSRAR
jgi:hypothetical protein